MGVNRPWVVVSKAVSKIPMLVKLPLTSLNVEQSEQSEQSVAAVTSTEALHNEFQAFILIE